MGGWGEGATGRIWAGGGGGAESRVLELIHVYNYYWYCCSTNSPSHNGNKYQYDWLKALDMRPMSVALRIATSNATGEEFSGQLA